MAISTYAELKTAVETWSQRGTAVTALVPDFIRLAESQIRNDIRVRAMVQTSTGTLSGTSVALPTRFAQVISVLINNDPVYYVDPTQWSELSDSATDRFTIIGETMYFKAGGDYSIEYYQWFADLSDDTDTNWLLTNFPDVYLFGALAECSVWTRDDPTVWRDRYMASVRKVHNTNRNSVGSPTVRPNGLVV